jgi:predicted flap endonuclease-1-like 5' DNA nuclease
MSKLFNPKAWYLVGIGAAALALDATRRLIKKRRHEATQPLDRGTEIPMMASEPEAVAPKPKPAAPPAAPTPAAAPTRTAAPKTSVKPDDLTTIKGIGPTFAKRLNEAGITTYAAVAAASADHLREVTKAPPMADPDEWIAQARQIA